MTPGGAAQTNSRRPNPRRPARGGRLNSRSRAEFEERVRHNFTKSGRAGFAREATAERHLARARRPHLCRAAGWARIRACAAHARPPAPGRRAKGRRTPRSPLLPRGFGRVRSDTGGSRRRRSRRSTQAPSQAAEWRQESDLLRSVQHGAHLPGTCHAWSEKQGR